eukprot:scpid99099/ scgid13470/ 
MSDHQQRRSSRANLGVPPDRLGEWTGTPPLTTTSVASAAGSTRSLGTSSTSSSRTRLLKARAELEAAKNLQALEQQELAQKKNFIDLELKPARAEIDDGSSKGSESVHSGFISIVELQPPLAAAVVNSSKVARLEEWVRTQCRATTIECESL